MSAPEKIYVRVNYGNVTARWTMSRQERSDVLYIRADIHEAEIGALKAEVARSQKDSDLLNRLCAAGVDNWEGYEDALDAGDEL